MVTLQKALDADSRFQAAEDMVDDVDKRIVGRQAADKVKKGKANLQSLATKLADGRKLLSELIDEIEGDTNDPDGPEPDDPDLPDEPDDPDEPGGQVEGWHYGENDLPGGDAESGGRKVVREHTITNDAWMGQGNTDYVKCIFDGAAATDNDRIADNIRLIDCTIKDNPGHTVANGKHRYLFYINMGHKEQHLGFVIFGGKVIGCSGTEFMESKGFDPQIINVDFSGSKFANGIRIRHGLNALITGCKGLKKATLRGHSHAVVNCPGTLVIAYAGNLPGYYKDWGPMHKAGGGNNMQRVEDSYIAGVGSVSLGFAYGTNDKYPAKGIVLAPDQKFTPLKHEGTQKKLLKSFSEVCKLGD